MSGNQQKTPFIAGLNRFADERMSGALGLLSKAVPAKVISVDPTGTIVTINFEIQTPVPIPHVTCPLVGVEFIRFPIQPGTPGYVIPADFYMGGMSGLGGGVATPTQQANLTNSVFFPVGNTDLDATDDPQALVQYGPNGVINRTQDGSVKSVLDKDGFRVLIDGIVALNVSKDGVSMKIGDNTFTFTAAGIDINGNGNTIIDGHNFVAHEHTGVQSGGGNTGPVS